MGATISVGDAAGVRKKESPALAPKARSRGRPSFYAVTSSSGPDDAFSRLSQVRNRCPTDQAHGWHLLSDNEARRLIRRLRKPKVDVEPTRE